jgi:hypothetical protein
MEGVLAMDENFAIEAFTLLALAVVIIVLRTIARWNTAGPKNFQLDDYVMPIAAVRGNRQPNSLTDTDARKGRVRPGDRRRVLRRRLVAWPGQQRHDRPAASSPRSGLQGVSSPRRRVQDPGDRLVAVYAAPVAAQDLHVGVLFAADVSSLLVIVR